MGTYQAKNRHDQNASGCKVLQPSRKYPRTEDQIQGLGRAKGKATRERKGCQARGGERRIERRQPNNGGGSVAQMTTRARLWRRPARCCPIRAPAPTTAAVARLRCQGSITTWPRLAETFPSGTFSNFGPFTRCFTCAVFGRDPSFGSHLSDKHGNTHVTHST